MSARVSDPPARSAVACPRCGAAVAPERDWCLECGEAARTQIVGARGWQLPIAIVLGVVLLAGVAIAVAFAELSNNAGDAARQAQTPTAPSTPPAPSTAAAPSPPAPPAPRTGTPGTPTPPATPTPAGTVGSWPAGRTAYTAVLLSSTAPAAARAAAHRLLVRGGGDPVGTLRSDDYSNLGHGYVVIFSGQYPTLEAAQRAAEGWHHKGSPKAYATLVKPATSSSAPSPPAPAGGAPSPSGGAAPAPR